MDAEITTLLGDEVEHDRKQKVWKWVAGIASLLFVVSLASTVTLAVLYAREIDDRRCGEAESSNSAELRKVVEAIWDRVVIKGQGKRGMERLTNICDDFGPRLSGSEALEGALDEVLRLMRADNLLQNVREERVDQVPNWKPGTERSLRLEASNGRSKQCFVLPLGGSIGTDGELTAEAVVVQSWEEFDALQPSEVEGKFVVWDVEWTGYSSTSSYRRNSAAVASAKGAIGSLVRSATPLKGSLYSPHTGSSNYEDGVAPIPTAALAVEDAALFGRLYRRGIALNLTLQLDCRTENNTVSKNVMGELVGSELPHEVIVIGGHTDSWYVGSGAHDDFGPFFSCWEALNQLAEMGLKPRRTIRVVGWTNEENGLRGGETYYQDHRNELNNTVFALETDQGLFTPSGLSFQGSSADLKKLGEIFEGILPIPFEVKAGGAGADISPLTDAGVPGASLTNYEHGLDGLYWSFHHTEADDPTHVDGEEFNLAVATLACVSLILAEYF